MYPRTRGGRREGRSDQEDQEAWSPGIQQQDYVIQNAGRVTPGTHNSGEARVPCSTPMEIRVVRVMYT